MLEPCAGIAQDLGAADQGESPVEEEHVREIPDLTLQKIGKQDLYAMSVGDLEERIRSLKAEVARCEQAIAQRGSTKSAAEKLFKL